MKFSELSYQRPDMASVKQEYETIILSFKESKNEDEALEALMNYYALGDKVSSMGVISSVRHSINTKDPFYDEENTFFDKEGPALQKYSKEMATLLLKSPYREALESKLGSLLFDQAELNEKTFDESILEDLQNENKRVSDYDKLLASAEIEFEGQTYNLSQMSPFTQSLDRKTRKSAQEAVSSFFEENEEALDTIYDDLVQIRTRIAKKLGYETFVDLAYHRLGRTDYTSKEVKVYRDGIYQTIVPIVKELTDRKSKRLGINDLKYYDLGLSYLTGNPTPKGDKDFQVEQALKMYHDMHPETGAFFQMMVDQELMDLESKPGKQGGGYCTFIPSNQTPFIFANFNGTSHDVDVLTHEAGHAFQSYQSKDLLPPYRWPTLEAAEIHSMSMEFLAWPYIDSFFKEDTEKYKFSHLSGALSFLPYGVAVDEFQHLIYENPEMSKEDRKKAWRDIEKKYLPYKDYDDSAFLEKGTFWYRQGHIFSVPFYYIDYTLAQVVALQYFLASRENYQNALDSYVALCKLGGSKTFTELIQEAHLENPFEKNTVKNIAGKISEILKAIDDSKL
jgi:M3 family oligoendopeptidase